MDNERTWVFFANMKPELEKIVVGFFDKSGRRLDEFKKKGSSVYLYDLSSNWK